MRDIRNFIEWLSYHPSADEISRSLVLDHLASLGACCARIGIFNSDDSLTFLGEYGFEDGDKGKTFTGTQWRAWQNDAADIALGRNPDSWSVDGKLLMFSLRHHGAIQGHLVIRFSNPIQDRASVEEIVLDYAIPLSLYLSLIGEGAKTSAVAPSRDDAGAEQLTARQLSILSGMVEGKTNHELATELGFSVSTIRHETMRIYQALSVSDRKEAARKALTLALI
jgi:DNA-binding CsgD family transcriptional regulator